MPIESNDWDKETYRNKLENKSWLQNDAVDVIKKDISSSTNKQVRGMPLQKNEEFLLIPLV